MKNRIKTKNYLLNTHREINLFYLKKIYKEAFYWYLIHKEHYLEKDEIRYMLQMKN